jgi:hypothetical protein
VQQVVEVVRDASRQHADALELLHVPRLGFTRLSRPPCVLLFLDQLLGQPLCFREVGGLRGYLGFEPGVQGSDLTGHAFVLSYIPRHPPDLIHGSDRRLTRRVGQLDVHGVALPGLELERRGPGPPIRWYRRHQATEARPVFVGDVGGECLSGKEARRNPEQAGGGPVGLDDDSHRVCHEVRIRGELEQLLESTPLHVELDVCRGELLVLLPQLLLGDSQLLQSDP